MAKISICTKNKNFYIDILEYIGKKNGFFLRVYISKYSVF